jgi:hypothetical protein
MLHFLTKHTMPKITLPRFTVERRSEELSNTKENLKIKATTCSGFLAMDESLDVSDTAQQTLCSIQARN